MLEEAVEYVAMDSPAAAHRLAVAVVTAAESLSELSERGRIVPEVSDSRFRELLVGARRLVYRVDDQHVAIVALVHGARDFRTWWKRYRQERPPN
jgi:Plasmid stabilisation system protein.